MIKDISSMRFGKLTALQQVRTDAKGRAVWLFVCDCGNLCEIRGDAVRRGDSRSCGCIRKERAKKSIKSVIAKNKARCNPVKKERLHSVWHSMICRCYNKSTPSYKYYGLRGIVVCDEWRKSYKSFREWAYANGYDANAPFGKCTIDRINVNGNYEPNNCRWVPMSVQAKNKRASHDK